jgi:hypothetical protein
VGEGVECACAAHDYGNGIHMCAAPVRRSAVGKGEVFSVRGGGCL